MSTTQNSAPHRSAVLLLTVLFVAQFAFFIFVAWHRFVDGDEGFYRLASRLVLEHNRPNVDFFYTQTPLLPYVYEVWTHVAGVSRLSAKLLAAFFTAALGSLLCAEFYAIPESVGGNNAPAKAPVLPAD